MDIQKELDALGASLARALAASDIHPTLRHMRRGCLSMRRRRRMRAWQASLPAWLRSRVQPVRITIAP